MTLEVKIYHHDFFFSINEASRIAVRGKRGLRRSSSSTVRIFGGIEGLEDVVSETGPRIGRRLFSIASATFRYAKEGRRNERSGLGWWSTNEKER